MDDLETYRSRIIKMTDDFALEKLWCLHCRAMQKVYNIPVECLYKPLDEDYGYCFCASCVDATKVIRELMNKNKGEKD
jgi:hypothetical protein